jgi:hypothetical protein
VSEEPSPADSPAGLRIFQAEAGCTLYVRDVWS